MSLELLRRLARDGVLRAIDYQLARQIAGYAEHDPAQVALATALVSIALGRGDPDFHTPAHIVKAAKDALDANHHHYTGPTGIAPLREAIAEDLGARYGLDYGADEVVVTAGEPDRLEAELARAHALVVRSDTKVTAERIDKAPHLTVIGRAGTGVDNIDVDTATRRGIAVLTAPGQHSQHG